MLRAAGLSLCYGPTRALDDVSVQIDAGEYVALTGPSGSGKSTLLQVLAGILLPTEGSVTAFGEDLPAVGDEARSALRLRRMGFVFQSADLVPELTLLENVALPLELLGARPRAAREKASQGLAALGIDEATSGRSAGAVSGGQAQRAAVARAVVHRPEVVFADEPTGALDSVNGSAVMTALGRAHGDGATVVLVTHDPHLAAQADRRIELRDGRVEG